MVGVGSIQGAGGSEEGTGARGGSKGVGLSSDGCCGGSVDTPGGPSVHLDGAAVGCVRTDGGALIAL